MRGSATAVTAVPAGGLIYIMAKSPRSRGISGGKIFCKFFYKIFGKASLALHGTGFVAGAAFGLPTRPWLVLGGLTTLGAATRTQV